MSALKFLYTKTLYMPELVSFFSWPSDPQRLPVVLAVTEVERLLAAFDRPNYRAFFATVYATGLRVRVREACRLDTRDIGQTATKLMRHREHSLPQWYKRKHVTRFVAL
jgi:integrase/recombinase XerD